MTSDDAKKLLEALGCSKVHTKTNTRGETWVRSSCPWARWKHTKGTDSHPSFGILPSEYRSWCFTCRQSATPIQLLWKLERLSGKKLSYLAPLTQEGDLTDTKIDKLEQEICNLSYGPPKPVNAGGIYIKGKFASYLAGELDQLDPGLPESDLNNFQILSDQAVKYLTQSRKLSMETIRYWGFKWHPSAQRIAIPVRNCSGKLVGITGHRVDGRKELKYIHSTGFNRDLYLFGEDRLVKGRPGILVEGMFDVFSTWQAGFGNVVALLGTHLSQVQAEKLVQFFSKLIVLTDGDKAGRDSAAKIESILSRRIHTVVPDLPEGSDPDDLAKVGKLEKVIPLEKTG